MPDLTDIYYNRFSDDDLKKMGQVWGVITRDFLQQFIPDSATVLDLGAGFCQFINSVQAERKIAIDANPEITRFADPDVEVTISDDLTLPMVEDGSLTNVFMSNFLEHLPNSDVMLGVLRTIKRKLSPKGSVIILQPNFRYVGPAYFDFIDHKLVITDVSLVEALHVCGFQIDYLARRFLPYTSKSRLPKSTALVKLYLRIPFLWRLFGGQTLVVASNKKWTQEAEELRAH